MPIEFSGFFEKRLQETLETTILELIKTIPTVKPKHLVKYIEAIKSLISLFPKEEITVEIRGNASGGEEPIESSLKVEEGFSEILRALEKIEKFTEDEK